jgi:secretion/DNA translocation related TadE-like protein
MTDADHAGRRASAGRAGGSAGEQGSASVWLLSVGLVLVLLAITVATAGGVTVARHRARNAADAGALAGALSAVDGDQAACAAAGRLVAANGGRLVACTVDRLDVTVTAEVRAPAGVGARAVAKAGPLRASTP